MAMVIVVPSTSPLVSVIIPAYNRERLIGDALASAYAQDYEPIEVIVVDDGSTDKTRNVVESFDPRVRYVHQQHLGVSPARNRGLAEAKGELIAFLDSDDLWTEGSLSYRVQQLIDNSGTEIVYGKTRVQNMVDATRLRRYADGEAVHHPCFSSMLIRRSAFEKVGGIDEAFDHSEDIDWVCRANEKQIVTLRTDYVVLEYRIHGGNMTSDIGENRGFLFRALKQSLDRRRKGG
jgi:glycosyltransferase involved in cell wall biosynthesis